MPEKLNAARATPNRDSASRQPEPKSLPAVAEGGALVDALLKNIGPSPESAARMLSGVEAGIRGSVLTRLQQERGNAYVQLVVGGLGRTYGPEPRVTDGGLQSEGRPLDATVRRYMEGGFGQSFHDVRVHTGAQAAQSAEAIDAVAFTVGNDVVFGEGQYAPQTPLGRLLLAHELAHVAQHARRPPEPGPALSRPGDRAEGEADRAAGRVAAGETASVGASAGASVSCEEEQSWWRTARDWVGTASDQVGLGGSLLQGLDDTLTMTLAGPGMASQAAGFGGLTGGIGTATGALGLVTGLATALDPRASTSDRVMGGLSATSGGIGVLGSIFPSLAAGGSSGLAATATGAGAMGSAGAFGTAGAALGSAGAVLGAGLAGYGAGRLLDSGVDWVGDRITGNEQGDHSISGMGADVMTAGDRAATGLMRSVGLYDESRPEYTQTLGWRLAEILPSWMQ